MPAVTEVDQSEWLAGLEDQEEEQNRRELAAATVEDLREFKSYPRPRQLHRTAERVFVSWHSVMSTSRKTAACTFAMLCGLWAINTGFLPLGIVLTLLGLPALVFVPVSTFHLFRLVKSGVVTKFGEPVLAEVTDSEFILGMGWGNSRVTYRFQAKAGSTHTGETKRSDNLASGHQFLVLYLAQLPSINMDYESSFFQVHRRARGECARRSSGSQRTVPQTSDSGPLRNQPRRREFPRISEG